MFCSPGDGQILGPPLAATMNFSRHNILGQGGFGYVYKGWIEKHSLTASSPETGLVVAVKKLTKKASQGQQEWLVEIKYLGQLCHPNLVKLIGYCIEDNERLLVYEFMPNGSLDNSLFTGDSYAEPLSWNIRMKIALGAAKGLAFLHNKAQVIYRDFRTSNILIDQNNNAKLSDFGFAKDGPTGDKSHLTASILGTYGYLAPEYIAKGEDSKCMGEYGNDIGRLSSKVSSVAVPLNSQTKGEMLQPPDMKKFCFNALKEATKDFHEDNVLGEGNFGHVYKGWIDEQSLEAAQPEMGMAIAVKRLNSQGCQGLQELVAEIKSGKLCHPNLVKLIGYCLEDDQHLLVYEFMPRGSLDQYVFRCNSTYQPFSWNRRLKIALGAAKGLAFLHDEAHVIFRDLKTSDILLDSNYNAKLCDFGMTKDGPSDGNSHVSTRALGTEEYSAPEYMGTGHLTKKSDVYSFGVVYLELLSGKRAIDNARPPGEQRLVEWARRQLSSKHNCLQVLDDNICDELRGYKFSAVKNAFNLAVTCLSTEPRLRPDMKEVVKDLEQLFTLIKTDAPMCSRPDKPLECQ